MSSSSIVISSILFRAYRQGMYLRSPSIRSIKSSMLALHLIITSALGILYSLNTEQINSSSISHSTNFYILIPPFNFLTNYILGGSLLSLMPNPSSSLSMIFLCVKGLVASRTITIILQVLATEITYLPLPLPSLAPSMIPGRSSNCSLAPLCLSTPGIQVTVVNS